MDSLKLINFFDGLYGVPFSWGTNDCCTFIVKYLNFATGKNYNHLAPFTWRSRLEAAKYLKQVGSISEVLMESVTCDEVDSIHAAKSGDILIVDQDGWDTAGVLLNGKLVWFREDSGLKVSSLENHKITTILRVY